MMKNNFSELLEALEKIQGLRITSVKSDSYGYNAVSFTYKNENLYIAGAYDADDEIGFINPYCWWLFANDYLVARFNALVEQETAIFTKLIKIIKFQA